MESFWAPRFSGVNHSPNPRQIRFEANRVRDLLRVFGMDDDYALKMINRFDQCWGDRRLTFEGFHEVIGTFPYVMEAQSFFRTIPMLAEHSPRDANEWTRFGRWMTDFPDTFVAKRYSNLLDRYERFSDPSRFKVATPIPEFQRGLPLAMCFPWQTVKRGLLLHNGTEPLSRIFFSTELPRSGRHIRVFVERYSAWLAAVAKTGWTPKSPFREHEIDKPNPRPGPALIPAVLEVCRHDVRDAWMLLWLLRVTGPHAGPNEKQYLSRIEGVPCVSATLSEIANATGLTTQQVRDAVSSLCHREFVCRLDGRPLGKGRQTTLHVEREVIDQALWELHKAAKR